jgi:hypothetical protein
MLIINNVDYHDMLIYKIIVILPLYNHYNNYMLIIEYVP